MPERIPNMAEALLVAHEEKLRKMEAAVRWRIRRMLSMLPPKGPGAPAARSAAPSRVAYLFAGTYGDFVQILPSLRRLATAYPKADLVLCGGEGYAREFATEVPRILRLAKGGEPWSWAFSPADLLLTNAVGVFRGRFDLAARVCARRSFGFRHEHESARGGYTRTLRLDPSVTSFAEENIRLLDLAQVPETWGVGPGPGSGMIPYEDAAVAARPAESWGRGRILFHIGSAGLKREFGLNAYSRIISEILSRLEERTVELLMGPGDEDVAAEVRIQSRFTPQEQSIPRLIRALRGFEGAVLCFNSFMAHLCHYLGKPAVVIHRGEIPFGYDCSVIHRQVVLRPENHWSVHEVLEALGVRQETEAGLFP
jgi:ADP-heptose:LPS heptosyltransferase